eukprot:5108161-Heterocapsa_arctica.AAC.1
MAGPPQLPLAGSAVWAAPVPVAAEGAWAACHIECAGEPRQLFRLRVWPVGSLSSPGGGQSGLAARRNAVGQRCNRCRGTGNRGRLA